MNNKELFFKLLDDKLYREAALRILQHYHDSDTVKTLITKLNSSQDIALNELIMMTLFRLYHREVEWQGKSWWNTRPNHKGPYYQPTQWELTNDIKLAIEKGFNQFDKETNERLLSVLRLNQISPSALNLEIEFDGVVDLLQKDKITEAQSLVIIEAAEKGELGQELQVKLFHKLEDCEGLDVFSTKVKFLDLWKAAKSEQAPIRKLHDDFIITTEYQNNIKQLCDKINNHKSESYYACLIMLNMKLNPVVPAEVKSVIHQKITKLSKDNRLAAKLLMPALLNFSDLSQLIDKDQYENMLNSKDKNAAKLITKIKKLYNKKRVSTNQYISKMSYKDIINASLENTGQAIQGKKFYTSQACFVCHTIDEHEVPKGPYLGTVGEKFSREFIAESILKPSAIMAQGFVSKWFKMKDGSIVEGFVTGFDGPAYEIRNVSGMTQKVDKSLIVESGDRGTSMMPEGLVNNMSLKDFNALLDYLQSLK